MQFGFAAPGVVKGVDLRAGGGDIGLQQGGREGVENLVVFAAGGGSDEAQFGRLEVLEPGAVVGDRDGRDLGIGLLLQGVFAGIDGCHRFS